MKHSKAKWNRRRGCQCWTTSWLSRLSDYSEVESDKSSQVRNYKIAMKCIWSDLSSIICCCYVRSLHSQGPNRSSESEFDPLPWPKSTRGGDLSDVGGLGAFIQGVPEAEDGSTYNMWAIRAADITLVVVAFPGKPRTQQNEMQCPPIRNPTQPTRIWYRYGNDSTMQWGQQFRPTLALVGFHGNRVSKDWSLRYQVSQSVSIV